MGQIIGTTNAVNEDEPTTSVVEMNLVRPEHPEKHRYMILTVIRQDKEAQCWFDLGPAKQFTRPQFRYITGGRDDSGKLYSCHNVGEAIEAANQLREGPFEQPEPPPAYRPGALAQAWHDQPDIRRKGKKKASTFGHGGALQRS